MPGTDRRVCPTFLLARYQGGDVFHFIFEGAWPVNAAVLPRIQERRIPKGENMSASSTPPVFLEPKPIEKIFNRALGYLVGLGIGPGYMYLLQVRGRKSGRLYETPVNMLDVDGKLYLVAPRGRTQWVRNAEATGEIALKKGRLSQSFRLRPILDAEKPELLKLYLERYVGAVQRYFTVKAGSPPESFRGVAPDYPVFELATGGQSTETKPINAAE